jgi:hypothetical protein
MVPDGGRVESYKKAPRKFRGVKIRFWRNHDKTTTVMKKQFKKVPDKERRDTISKSRYPLRL